ADAVVLDPWEDTWAATVLDPASAVALVDLLPRVEDAALRAGVWNSVRTSFHQARITPTQVLELVASGMRTEDNDEAVRSVVPWAIRTVAGLSAYPGRATALIHRTLLERAASAPAGSTLQLAAFQSVVATCVDEETLRGWL